MKFCFLFFWTGYGEILLPVFLRTEHLGLYQSDESGTRSANYINILKSVYMRIMIARTEDRREHHGRCQKHRQNIQGVLR